MPTKRSSKRVGLADEFLAATTPVEQAEAYARWFRQDYASWLRLQGMKYPVNRQIAEKGMRELLVEVADPSHPEHEGALGFLREARETVLAAPSREKRARAEARAEREREKYEAQGVVVDDYKPVPLQKLRGERVWLYHGTSSVFLPEIRKYGLRSRGEHGKHSNVGRTGAHLPSDRVFLTARADGQASAWFYAERAAQKHGGKPVVLRVLVDGDALDYDRDDEDIGSGRYQFEIDSVGPGEIMEIDGVRV